MSLYDIFLFAHFLGLISLFVSFGVLQRGGAALRSSQSVDHLRVWVGLVRRSQRGLLAGLVILLVSGIFMAAERWTFTTSWIVVGIVAVVVIAVVFPSFTGRKLRNIDTLAGSVGDGAIPPELKRRVADRGLWVPLSATNIGAIGVVWLMTAKPGWVGSLTVVLGMTALGAIIGYAMASGASPRRNTG